MSVVCRPEGLWVARVWAGGPLHWPAYVQLSSDHTHPRWRFQSHRRLKSVICTMEWCPDVDASAKSSASGAAQASMAHRLSDAQKAKLTRVSVGSAW